MPADEETADPLGTVPGAPEWGGVPRDGGDNADATGGAPTPDVEVSAEPTDGDANDETPEADADAEAGEDSPSDE